ncbi:hypothetical protein CFBP6626_00360 [Agrobacterium tumefaciens]|nr:hypothetical protein CFBP6626_00360 [Agrobacterium tumefaciens]CUX41130.1 hypothetical protein AGR5A_Cc90333 [Agrobacterium genomosp. 5 str. CFBP 6626]
MSTEKELKDQRIPIMMSGSELAALDDWSFNNRIRSRGEAIRRLIQIGLVLDGNKKELNARFKDIHSKLEPIAAKADSVAESDKLTKQDGELITSVMELTMAIVGIAPIIRKVTGLANNFTAEGELSTIIETSKEIEEAWAKSYPKLLAVTQKPFDTSE